jgi:hypothetical protein
MQTKDATQDQPILVTSETLQGVLDVLLVARRPLFVWGNPGIGKSQNIGQFAKRHDALLIDVRASQWDAVDTRGIPYLTDAKGTAWAIPEIFPSQELADQHEVIVLFLDELNSAPPSVQAALYQLILDRRLGDYVLPDNVFLVAAGNLETDRAVTNRMGTALASRFFHVRLGVDVDGWTKWALQADLHEAVIAFIRWRPAHLHVFDPKSPSKTQPDPRGYEYISDVLGAAEQLGINGAVEEALVIGKLGEAIGQELLGFLKIYRRLPDPDGVILAPDAAPIDDDPSVNYALCTALARRATRDNFDNITIYANRLKDDPRTGEELSTLLVRAAAVWNPEVQQSKAFIRWASENQDVLL